LFSHAHTVYEYILSSYGSFEKYLRTLGWWDGVHVGERLKIVFGTAVQGLLSDKDKATGLITHTLQGLRDHKALDALREDTSDSLQVVNAASGVVSQGEYSLFPLKVPLFSS
jgi:hypothetical protein